MDDENFTFNLCQIETHGRPITLEKSNQYWGKLYILTRIGHIKYKVEVCLNGLKLCLHKPTQPLFFLWSKWCWTILFFNIVAGRNNKIINEMLNTKDLDLFDLSRWTNVSQVSNYRVAQVGQMLSDPSRPSAELLSEPNMEGC